ncbi:MAG: folate-binding protein YgfZ [Actinobacteria bacterium]|nr:folate-binding protein YgfZ [Actinomycetota bacterium]
MIVVARTTRDVLVVHGPEAVTWLQGQLSQDVAGLAVGEAAPSFVLAPQGKVAGWGRLVRTAEDAVQIDVDPGAGEAWAARLERFKLRTKAEVHLRTDVSAVSVRGAQLPGWLPAPVPSGAVPGCDRVDAGDGALAEALAAGAVEVPAEHLEAERIRAGVPRWGAELDDDTIPATVGQWVIDASVSFTKGCYTGQELVARIDSRGGNVPRHLAVVAIDGPPPAPGAEVTVGDAAAGQVTSSAPDPSGSGSVALAYVPRAVELPAVGRVEETDALVALAPLSPPA